jgi:hypothetical protein
MEPWTHRRHRVEFGEGVEWEGLSALANRHLAKILLVLLVVLVGMFGYLNFKIGEVEDLQDHTHVCKVDDPFSPFPRVFCP